MRNAFIAALTEVARQDPRVYLLTGDVGFSVFESFASEFPKRFINTGVAEQNMTSVAAGLAACGKIPFTYSIANFPTLRCLEQIRVDACYPNLDVKIVAVGGGLAYGPMGSTHHGTEDIAVLRSLPNMKVIAPADAIEASLATWAAAVQPGPVYIRLSKAGEPQVHKTTPSFKIGRAITLMNGDDLTLIATGNMVASALRAAQELSETFGYSVRVLSMHTIKPLDSEAVLKAARETTAILTIEEHSIIGGLGSAVAEVLADSGTPVALRRMALPDAFILEVGTQEYLRGCCKLSVEDIVQTADDLLATQSVHLSRSPVYSSQ